MKNRRSTASILIFTGSMLCFFLPFVTLSCGGAQAAIFTGKQLATGTTPSQSQQLFSSKKQEISADPFALLAGLCAVAGVGLSLLGTKLAKSAAISGGAGAVSLFVMRLHLNGQVQQQAGGMVQVNYQYGYITALLLLVAGAVWNAYLYSCNKSDSSG